uniref:RxLR effector protein 24 n=1 Tax=Phytophthora brassicae TaxID=187813 RepID=RLR24_PHYBB|nr:RecName: Full=RxLR effector protein 24; Flags: Precursor [Phytophthora brassicae]AVA31271.1 RxLR24 effector [Phytophthora brassicae]
MRLLIWVLFVTLVTFVSNTTATSTFTDPQVTSGDIEALTHLLDVESNADAKRFLRTESKNDLKSDADTNGIDIEDEERGFIPSSITNAFSKMKTGWSNFKSNQFEKAFQRMNQKGETPTTLAKRLDIGKTAEKRFEKTYEKYTAWWINHHTNAGT